VVFEKDGSVHDVIEGRSEGYTEWVCNDNEKHDLGSDFTQEIEFDGLLDAAEDALD
jgi:hypothetical protein